LTAIARRSSTGGRIGLIIAVDRYDPGRGSFAAFVVTTVYSQLKCHLGDKTWGLHVARRPQVLRVDPQLATVMVGPGPDRRASRGPRAHRPALKLGWQYLYIAVFDQDGGHRAGIGAIPPTAVGFAVRDDGKVVWAALPRSLD
jgi:hypothetical protein